MTDSAARGLFGEYSQLFGSGNGESHGGSARPSTIPEERGSASRSSLGRRTRIAEYNAKKYSMPLRLTEPRSGVVSTQRSRRGDEAGFCGVRGPPRHLGGYGGRAGIFNIQ